MLKIEVPSGLYHSAKNLWRAAVDPRTSEDLLAVNIAVMAMALDGETNVSVDDTGRLVIGPYPVHWDEFGAYVPHHPEVELVCSSS